MATGELTAEVGGRERKAYMAFGVVVAIGLVIVLLGLRRPPQMGPDDKTFATVDALYTAVRLRDPAKVSQCEARLHAYRDAGQLPADAASYLDGVIASARDGSWESATHRLYDFMSAQRREGPVSDASQKRKNASAKRREPGVSIGSRRFAEALRFNIRNDKRPLLTPLTLAERVVFDVLNPLADFVGREQEDLAEILTPYGR